MSAHGNGQSLTEISHLFLSTVREKQTEGVQRPVRVPPGGQRVEAGSRSNVSIDMTAEEFARMAAGVVVDEDVDRDEDTEDSDAPVERRERAKAVQVVIGGHLGEDLGRRAGEYARHVARAARRVGVVYVEEGRVRVCCVDSSSPTGQRAEEATLEQVAGALGELNWDVNRWLVVGADVRPMLEGERASVLLCECGHEGVVAAYRALKGLAEVRPGDLGVALLDAKEHAAAGRVHRKISSVAEQYLGCAVRLDSVVIPSAEVHEHELLVCDCDTDEAWGVLNAFFEGAEALPKVAPTMEKSPEEREVEAVREEEAARPVAKPTLDGARDRQAVEPVVAEVAKPPLDGARDRQAAGNMNGFAKVDTYAAPVSQSAPVMRIVGDAAPVVPVAPVAVVPEVIELPAGADVVGAVVRHAGAGLVGCPAAVRPPMMGEGGAEVAVTRGRRLVLLAGVGEGLAGLERVARAHAWLTENRMLVAMALPQMNIDAHQMPELRVLVDWQDAGAEGLRSLLGAGHVSVQTYRKLTWGGKMGVLVEAA